VGVTPSDLTFSIPIKSTSCVERAYLMCYIHLSQAYAGNNTAAYATTRGIPLRLTVGNVTFRSNGTDLISLPADALRLYGSTSQLGTAGFAASNSTTTAGDTMGWSNVYVLEFGTGPLQTQDVSNLTSLRELSAPSVSRGLSTLLR
jgi:hypothetical protein